MASAVPSIVPGCSIEEMEEANRAAFEVLWNRETAPGPNGGTFQGLYSEYDRFFGGLFFYFLLTNIDIASWFSIGVYGYYETWLRDSGFAPFLPSSPYPQAPTHVYLSPEAGRSLLRR